MESEPNQSPLVVIVGETGSGKSALAIELAERFNGEIIAADSRTIYRGMDIGTAKPSAADRQRVPHYLVDIVAPDEPFSAADFKSAAQLAIQDITNRGKLPFLVGGTGLYIDAVVYDFSFAAKSDPDERARLQKMDVYELQAELEARGIPQPANVKNRRHLIRQLETGGLPAADRQLRENTLIIGLQPDREQLKRAITQRVDRMLQQGLEQEVRQLVDLYGWDCAVLQTIGYQEFWAYFEGQESLEETKQRIITNTIQYAKRQRTWFRRNKSIHWLREREESVDLMTSFLNK
jgi:tRNA dimethylallyltransferase